MGMVLRIPFIELSENIEKEMRMLFIYKSFLILKILTILTSEGDD